jgi:diguanylate cyclase (GGDEF)-like protein
MPDEHDLLLEAIYEIAAADTEAVCITRIDERARVLFGEYHPVLVTGQNSGGADRRFDLIAADTFIGQLVTGPVPEEVARRIETFAAHAALALHQTRRLDDHQHRSRHDALTGLHNRREFREVLSRELPSDVQSSRRLALIVIDLIRFKEVNDQHGHAAGDRLLRRVAAAISTHRRPSDTAFRIGGDEFAVLLGGVDRAEAAVIADRAVGAIAHLTGSHGASWGVATAPIDTTDADQLLSLADADMYRRKQGHAPSAAPATARRSLTMIARLTAKLMALDDQVDIADAVVQELHTTFGYFLAVIQRLDDDVLRVIAGAGPLARTDSGFLAWEQSVHVGVNGRAARSAQTAVITDTHLDPDYLAYERNQDPGSEVSVPMVLDGSVWGVLNVEQIAAYAFDESDVLLLEAVAVITASAITRTAHNTPDGSTGS